MKKTHEVGKVEINIDNTGNIKSQDNYNNAELIINKGTIEGNQTLINNGTAYNFGFTEGQLK